MGKKTNIAAIYRLSPLQEGILYHTLQAPGADIYLEQFSCSIEELHDPQRWRAAWQACVARHPTLRTLFTWEKRDQPLQVVRHEVEVPWQETDLRHLSGETQATAIEQLRVDDRGQAFDLEKAPLLRFHLVQTGASDYYFLLTFHHILLDGWSQRLLLSEAMANYRSGGGQALPPAPSYESFVSWLEQRDTTGETEFWREQLSSLQQPTLLAANPPHSRGTAEEHGGAVQVIHLTKDLTAALERAAAGHRVTLNTLVVSAWALVLATHTARKDVVFGTTVAGRPPELPGAQDIVGLCINTLPLRLDIPANGALADWLRTVQAMQLQCRHYGNASLADIQKCSGLEPGQSLFDNILVFEKVPDFDTESSTAAMPRVKAPKFDEYSHYPLAMLVEPGEVLQIAAVHQKAQISSEAAADLLRHFEHVLTQFAQSPAVDLADIDVLPADECHTIEVDWNDAPAPGAATHCIHQLVEQAARRYPDRLALVDGASRLSLARLNADANRLAWHLIDQGIKPGAKVVIFMERGAQAIISFLAVLKAGGVYIPIDARTPAARVATILSDLQHHQPLVLSQPDLVVNLPDEVAAPLCPELERDTIDARPEHNPDLEMQPDQLAYIIYTSGSTGAPKGVMIEHRALVVSTRARLDYYPEQPGTFLLVSSLAVDSSVAGIYWCLCSGATLLLARQRLEQDLDAMAQLIDREQVTHLLCIPSLYQLLLDHGQASQMQSLRTVIVAGEACMPGLIERHRAVMGQARLYNEYGPSECTVWATVADLSTWQPHRSVPIGRPISGTVAYILDSRQRSVPAGVPGELYLGGDALARGYLNDPDRTAQSFVTVDGVLRPRTFRDRRLYRTGDRARYMDDHQIEFLGRVDNQIKVRGHRVEPEEIEQVLCRHPDVLEAAVFLQGREAAPSGSSDTAGTAPAQLIACVTLAPGTAATATVLRDYTGQQLPAHMVPHRVRPVLDLPRETGGKVARRALATFPWQDANTSQDTAQSPAAQRDCSESEQILLDIWREVLGVEEINLDSNFFELGGDSLLSIRVLSRARKAGLEISSEDFFDQPTVAAQANLAASPQMQLQTAVEDSGELVISPIQGWFFRTISSHQNQWNQSLLLRLTATISGDILERAVATLMQRHEALRTAFDREDDAWRPRLIDPLPQLPLRCVDLSQHNEEQLIAAIEQEATAISRGFDLSRGPLIQCLRVDTAPGLDDRLLLCAHHLIIDAESWRILVQELTELCSAFAAGRAPGALEQGSSYSGWLSHLSAYANSDKLAEELPHWTSVIAAQAAHIPLDYPLREPPGTNAEQGRVCVSLPQEETGRLMHDLPRAFNCDLSEALLTALLRCLMEWTQAEHLHVDVEGHGREMLFPGVDPSHTVGWLTTVHPLLLRQVADEAPTDTLLRVKETLRKTPNRGLGFGVLRYLSDIGQSSLMAGSGPSRICFNYLGRMDLLESAPGPLRVESQNIGELRAPEGPMAYMLEVNCWVRDGKIHINLAYSSALHDRATIEGLAENYLAELRQLVAAQDQTASTVYSPSDFPLANLEQGELDQITQLLSDHDEP